MDGAVATAAHDQAAVAVVELVAGVVGVAAAVDACVAVTAMMSAEDAGSAVKPLQKSLP